MKRFLAILILILTFQTPSQADDIRDFQIEGMSIGDSLLDYFSKDEIEQNKKKAFSWNGEFFTIGFYKHSRLEIFDSVTATVKAKDKKYIIYAIEGVNFYQHNVEDCYKKKDEIVSELSDFYKDTVEKFDAGTTPHSYDKSGKSKAATVEFWFDSGALSRVTCEDWSKKLEKENNWWDNLKVIVNSKEFTNFLMDEYYK